MKSSIFKSILFCSLFFLCASVFGQELVTNQQWKDDVIYLQKRIHKDYPFLFKKISKENWDAKVAQLIADIPNLEPHEIKVGITKLVSAFEYGHTQVPFQTLAKDAVLPVNLYHFEDGLYIEGVQKGAEKALGAKVVAIENTPIEEALLKIRPVVPAENDSYFKGYGLRFLTIPSVLHAQGILPAYSDKVTMTLKKEGSTFTHIFKAVPLSELSRDYGFTTPNDQWISARDQTETPLYLKHLTEKLYYFEYLEDAKTVYVRQSSVFNDDEETLEAFYKRLFDFIDNNAVEKLIYDVRLNGGGNNYNNKFFIKEIMARPQINQQGNFFYIIGRNTFSAAQNLTNEVENYTEAIIVGEPTAENKNFYGDARKVSLPNSGINTYLSYAWWQDKPQWENQDWTLPHLAVTMTFEDYVTNNDVVLNKALQYTPTDFILDPMEHLTQLFIKGQIEQFKTDAVKIAKDPAYRYHDFQDNMSKAGFRLYQNGDVPAGTLIMELLTYIYPESASAWNSLGYVQQQSGNIDGAKKSYQKVITLDIDGQLAKAAQKQLKKLE